MALEPHPIRDALVGRVLVGAQGARYRLDELIGEGGQGWVYRATWEESETKTVVVKVLRPDVIASDSLRRFQREAQVLGMLSREPNPCPHVVRFYDHAQAEAPTRPDGKAAGAKLPFTVLEYVDGTTLERVIAMQHGQGMPLERVRHLLGHISVALESVHARDIVHRDLKPSNVLLTGRLHNQRITASLDTPDEIAKVTDFGLVKIVSGNMERTAQVAGASIGYAPPEQYEKGNQRVSARSDVFSLAAVVYEMIAGVAAYPFQRGENPLIVLTRILKDARPSLRKGKVATELAMRPEALDALDNILARALNPDPALRHASVREFARAVLSALPTASDRAPVSLPPMSGARSAPAPSPSLRSASIFDRASIEALAPSTPPKAETSATATASAPAAQPPTRPSAKGALGSTAPVGHAAARVARAARDRVPGGVTRRGVAPPPETSATTLDAAPPVAFVSQPPAPAPGRVVPEGAATTAPLSRGSLAGGAGVVQFTRIWEPLRIVRLGLLSTSGDSALLIDGEGAWLRRDDAPHRALPIALPFAPADVRGVVRYGDHDALLFGESGLVARLREVFAGRPTPSACELLGSRDAAIRFEGARVEEDLITLVGAQRTSMGLLGHVTRYVGNRLGARAVASGSPPLLAVCPWHDGSMVACGVGGALVRFAQGVAELVAVAFEGSANLHGIATNGADTVVVGTGGHAARLGVDYQAALEPVQTPRNLLTVFSAPDGSLWSGAEQGRLLRRRVDLPAPAWQRANPGFDAPAPVLALWADTPMRGTLRVRALIGTGELWEALV